ncbi:hypothetical protein C8R44DRAFT_858632 [Mycena epipterygia]|nr:hypothetical protein C8R44DRAFT_858632 [Mycena epipterygia]
MSRISQDRLSAMPRTVPKHSPDLGVRVLSLDGGGAGALSELLILERMMYRTKTEGQLDLIPSPWECFELIGGSGMGGIIALMLGCLRMSVKEAILAYDSLRPQSKIGFAEEFQTSKFEAALKNIFQYERMNDVASNACKIFVCAMNERNMNAGIPHLLRSYSTVDEPASGCMIWEAARATSATPGLFKPTKIGHEGMKQQYIDGGLGNNNPTSLVLREAHKLYPSQVILVASIGAGHPETIQIPTLRRLNTMAKVMKKIATDCEKTHEDIGGRFRETPNTYCRFNVQQGMQALEPKHWNKLAEVSAHTDAYMRTEEAQAKLSKAVKLILNPAIPVLDPLVSIPVSAIPVHLRACPHPSFRFTGRTAVLQKMTEYFNTDVGRRHVFLLYGLGGAGKSQIAFKFVETSNSPKPRFSDIYFIDSSTQQTIENDLATVALAKQIGKAAKDTLLWLSHQHREWLIVFNNADDIHLNLVKFFPAGSHGNILITSRNPDLGQHAQAKHKVDRMELEDARDLLLSTADYEKTAETTGIATQIVQKLHCFPLAVAQAGAYIYSSRALHKYLNFYENTVKRIQLMKQSPPQSNYEWSVYTTWQMSFEKLSNQAAQLLQLCSFIHHDGITEGIFERASSYKFMVGGPPQDKLHDPSDFLASFLENSTWDSMKFVALTNELGCYSLIQLEEASRHVSFSIHPLVHEWCRSTVELDTTEVCMHKLMGMSISSADVMFKHQIFPHLHALLFIYTQECGWQTNIHDFMLAAGSLWVYVDEGKHRDGQKLADAMLGSDNIKESETLSVQLALAAIYMTQGQLDDAKGLEEGVLKCRTELLGQDHLDTLVAMGNLARTYAALGQFNQAEELETTVLNKHREIFGEDHPDTLLSMANLACTHSALGEFSQAEELETTVLNKCREIFGEAHPDTLRAMANLACTHSDLGQSRQAQELEIIVLNKRKEIFGEDHPATLRAMANLASTHSALGELSQAEKLETIVLNKHRDIFGEDHPDTLVSMANLACTYGDLGRFSKAEELEIVVLNKRREIFGDRHPDTQLAIRNLAQTRSNLAQPGQEDDWETLETRRRVEMTESIIDDSEPDDTALLFR